METSHVNTPMKKSEGLTLIEVLIALAILAIALTAIIQSTSQLIVHTRYLQNRTIATLVGTNIINEARLGLINLPTAPDKMEKELEQLGQTWVWKGSREPTSNARIQKITVDVDNKSDNKPFAHLVSYFYVTKKS